MLKESGETIVFFRHGEKPPGAGRTILGCSYGQVEQSETHTKPASVHGETSKGRLLMPTTSLLTALHSLAVG